MTRALGWLAHEFKTMLPSAVFFLITFHMIALTKAVILTSHGISVIDASTATVAALVVAKDILVVDKLPVAHYFSGAVWHNVIWRTSLFYVVTLLFHVLERMASYYLQPGPQTFHLEHIMEWQSWPNFLIVQMWLIALLSLYTLIRELIDLVGADTLRRLITQHKHP